MLFVSQGKDTKFESPLILKYYSNDFIVKFDYIHIF